MNLGYHVECIEDETQLKELYAAWTSLMVEDPAPSLFLTPEWVDTWWRHRNVEAGLWVLAVRDQAGRLAGLAPWMCVRQRVGPLRLKRIAFLGSGIVYPVHLDIIAPPAEKKAVCEALLSYLDGHRRDWDVLDLGDLEEMSYLKSCLKAARRPFRELAPVTARFTCLPQSFEAYERDLMTGSRRGHMRQRRRKLEREHPGEVVFEAVTDTEDVRHTLDVLKTLNQDRFHDKQQVSSFDYDGFVAFYQDVAIVARQQGWLRLYRLRVGEEVIAAVYGFLYRDVFYAYQAAFDAAWGRYSPGYLLFTHCIQEAIAQGAHEWNMMRGDQDYKLSWTHEVRYDSHLMLDASLPGHLWLLGGSLLDNARGLARERLPQPLQDRIGRIIAGKGQHHEPATTPELSD